MEKGREYFDASCNDVVVTEFDWDGVWRRRFVALSEVAFDSLGSRVGVWIIICRT